MLDLTILALLPQGNNPLELPLEGLEPFSPFFFHCDICHIFRRVHKIYTRFKE